MIRKRGIDIWILLVLIWSLSMTAPVFAAEEGPQTVLKYLGLIAAILGIVGIGIAGFIAGKNYDSYTGWERYTHGVGQFFNRKPFAADTPTYRKSSETRRIGVAENLMERTRALLELMHSTDGQPPRWRPDMGIEGLPDALREYYRSDPEAYDWQLKNFQAVAEQKKNWPGWSTHFALIEAWSKGMSSLFETADDMIKRGDIYPPDPQGPPEQWDFRRIRRERPLPFKSPDHAARLIKKVTHTFGATLVGITKLNPDWVYQGKLRGVGPTDFDVPDHWEYAIVYATPHEWDMFYANAVYGTSYDAYSRERIIGGRLEAFIQDLGYPARAHVPPMHYDLMTPPIAVDAGLGEQGRMGLLITPELGANARLGVVTTNIPMTVDRPIDFGVQAFCRKCKICAERCVTGAISHADEPDQHFGYQRWRIKCELCFNVWASMATSHPGRGCRVCLAVCPYSRKNNWLHTISRFLDSRDPTGGVSTALLWMQKTFFRYPKARDFLPPPKGRNATYHAPPDWLITENWFDVDAPDNQEGRRQ